jgi:hypothetical protein
LSDTASTVATSSPGWVLLLKPVDDIPEVDDLLRIGPEDLVDRKEMFTVDASIAKILVDEVASCQDTSIATGARSHAKGKGVHWTWQGSESERLARAQP